MPVRVPPAIRPEPSPGSFEDYAEAFVGDIVEVGEHVTMPCSCKFALRWHVGALQCRLSESDSKHVLVDCEPNFTIARPIDLISPTRRPLRTLCRHLHPALTCARGQCLNRAKRSVARFSPDRKCLVIPDRLNDI